MIKRIHIQNFKSLRDVTVDLGQFNVLIGQNGAGKSSFLQALQVLSWLTRFESINERLVAEDLSYSELVYLRAASSHITWNADLEVTPPGSTHPIDAEVTIAIVKHRHVYVHYELVMPKGLADANDLSNSPFSIGRDGRRMVARENGHKFTYENVSLAHSALLHARERGTEFPVLSSIASEIGGFRHYEIWGPEPLRQPSLGRSVRLGEKGANLPSVLATLRRRDPHVFGTLVNEIKQAYPWLDSIEIRRLGGGRYSLSFLETQATDKRIRRLRYEPSQVSDGFLRLLALTTLKYQSGSVSVLGYEEPENGMHPGMLRESVNRLRDIAARGTQVIVTTHSPFLLQYMLSEQYGADPQSELKLVWRDPDGCTNIAPPDVDSLVRARKQGIGIGELWGLLLDEKSFAGRGSGTASANK